MAVEVLSRPLPSSTDLYRQFQLHHRGEALAVMGREAEGRERGKVVRSGVALVARPGVRGMARGEELHQAITHRFRDHRRRGDRVAVRVAVDDRSVDTTELGTRQTVHQHEIWGYAESRQGALHRED